MVMELTKLVRPLSTVDNTRDYARVSHSRQWSNYNFVHQHVHHLLHSWHIKLVTTQQQCRKIRNFFPPHFLTNLIMPSEVYF